MKKTALTKYQRLEASGLWRAAPDAQRVDVIVSVGEATLTITDLRDRVQAHWSIAAVARANPAQTPAIYHPDGDPGETLELAEDEAEMVTAIETLRGAVARQRPKPGRLRLVGVLASAAAVAALVLFWLPGAARQHALGVVPMVKRAEIGRALFGHLQQVTGPVCEGPGGAVALAQLARRLPSRTGQVQFLVVRDGIEGALRLLGGVVLINADLVEDHDEPDVLAGHIIAAYLRAEAHDPLAHLLEGGGLSATLRLLATGALPDDVLRAHAERLMRDPPGAVSPDRLLAGFAHWQVRVRPYAYAVDITGETTIELIEADPYAGTAPPPPLLSDADWLRLQEICSG
ncbi:MAG: hypothetical protein ACNA7M_03115 [Roseovarius sp.]